MGKLDWVHQVPLKYADTLAKTSPDLIQDKYLVGWVKGLGLKTTQEPFDDVNVRHALMTALDYEAILKSIYIEGEVYASPYNSATPYYTPFDELPASIQELYSNDPEKARQMLADAGHPDGFPMKVYIEAGVPEVADLFAMVAAMWADINVEVEIIPVEKVGLLGLLYSHEYEDSLSNPIGTIRPYLMVEFSEIKNYVEWDFGYSVDGDWYEEQFYEACAMTDAVERTLIFKELGIYRHEALAKIPFPAPYVINAYWPWMKNYYGELNASMSHWTPAIERLWIDQDLKVELGYD